MITELKDLQVGDEFLVGSNSKFRWYKLIRPMKMSKSRPTRWATARVSTKVNVVPGRPKYNWKTKTSIPTTRNEFICTGDNHNIEIYADLNWKSIWLIKRNGGVI